MQSKDFFLKFKQKLHNYLTPTRSLVFSFIAIIFIGALLLLLPFATKGKGLSFMDALFTATSATCVTGLTLFNVADTFTIFGQIVILFLIQIGGLGFMTITSSIYLFLGKKLSLHNRLQISENLEESDMSKLRRLLLSIMKFTFIMEGFAAILLTICFAFRFDFFQALWYGIFHSVSAFCNAGFDIFPSSVSMSMSAFISDPIVLIILAILIISGGIGFLVVADIGQKKNPKKFSVHSKIVLAMTSALLAIGTVIFLSCEYNNADTIGNMNFFDKLVNSFFLSASTRTAGFATFDISALTTSSTTSAICLMFIGASPGSTGGGIKTSTIFVLMFAVFAVMRNKHDVIVDMRKISRNTIYKASSTLMLALLITITSIFILTLSEDKPLVDIIFEQVSAYATVGLSRGITDSLSVVGKIVLTLNMFLGRVTAMTFLVSISKNKVQPSAISYPDANIVI